MSKADQNDSEIYLGRLSDHLGFRLRRLQNELARNYLLSIKHLNVRPGVASILELVNVNPGISQVKLGQEMGMDKSAVGILVDDLEERGYIERRRSKQDRRNYELTLTQQGRVLIDDLFEELKKTERHALAVLEPHELASIGRILDKVYHNYVRSSVKDR